MRLRPGLGEAHLALAQYYLWGEKDNDRALAELAPAAELLPNSAELPLVAAFIYKRQNKFRERIAALQRAESLDPRNRRVLGYLVATHAWLREWREAMQALAKIEALLPPQASHDRLHAALLEFRLTGDLGVLRRRLDELETALGSEDWGWNHFAAYQAAMLERDYARAAQHLASLSPERFEPVEVEYPKSFYEALLLVASNADPDSRQRGLKAARASIEQRLASMPQSGGVYLEHSGLALIDTFLGRKDEALGKALRAIETTSEGSIERHGMLGLLALIHAQTGEPDKALDLIEHVLTKPVDLRPGVVYNVTLADLKFSWVWDPLRSHPRFQQILAAPEPKTVY